MSLSGPSPIPREEFEQFVVALTHDIRNRLNGIALEVAFLAETAGADADSAKLQQLIQDCSSYLKSIRDNLAPDESHTETVALTEFVKKLRGKKPL